MLFILNICIEDCLRHVNATIIYAEFANWDFELWKQSQIDIAKEYPILYQDFTYVVTRLSHVQSSYDVDDIRQSLEYLQEKTKTTQSQEKSL